MRFVAALTSAPLALAAIDYVEFCNNEDSRWNLNQDVTDAISCAESFKANYDGSCDDLPEKSNEQHACVFDWWNNVLDQDDEYASEEFINNEFLANINDDPMMAEILSTLNAQNRFMENYNCESDGEGGFTNCQPKPLCGEGDDPTIENCAAQRSLGEAQACYDNSVPPQVISNVTETTQCYDKNGNAFPEPGLPGIDAQGNQMLKRFVELKQLVSWMQPKDKRISRYCFYGCWCLPDGAHSFVAGEGHPVDLVDRACQLFWFCYVCAKQEMTAIIDGKEKTCVPDKTKYTFRFKYNKKKPNDYKQRDIICKDNWYLPMNTREKWKSNCAKAFCECDRGIAMRLYQSWKHWDKSRHRIWSQRVTECPTKKACELMPINTAKQRAAREQCLRKGCLFIVKDRCLYGAGGRNELDQNPICCGMYEDDGSRFEMRDHGGKYACCNHHKGTGYGDKLPWNGAWYNKLTHCCANGKVEGAGHADCP